jgi:hypothetical protein
MSKPFRESFFERIIDVQWDTEPKVLWMAGSGGPLIINSMIFGDNRAWVFTSADGKNWKGKDYGFKSEFDWGFGAFYNGGWMRRGLEPGAQATWVLVGSDGRQLSGSATAASIDGLTISSTQFLDRWHHGDGFFPLSSSVEIHSDKNAPNWHTDLFTSTDGQRWSPDHYDNITSGGLPPSLAAARAIEQAPYRSRPSVSSTLVVPDTRLIIPEATPFDSSSGLQSKADQIVFNPNAIKAGGKVQKGPYKGQVITCSLATYQSPPEGGAHGGPEIQIIDAQGNTPTDDEGKPKYADCRIARTLCINYGHYIFVVGGSSGGEIGKGQKSTISWSDDGVTWHPKELGLHSQINVLAVGPQK